MGGHVQAAGCSVAVGPNKSINPSLLVSQLTTLTLVLHKTTEHVDLRGLDLSTFKEEKGIYKVLIGLWKRCAPVKTLQGADNDELVLRG